MGFTRSFNRVVQIQPGGARTREGVPGVEVPPSVAREFDANSTGTGAVATATGGGGTSSDTNNDALPANAGARGEGGSFRVPPAGKPASGGREVTPGDGQASKDENSSDPDYTELDSSKRDLYLTGSHGLTSLYPAILLTMPRTSKVIDTTSGLTSTPFIIDLNNTVKKSIESDVRNAINQLSPVLQLTTAQYTQNLITANQYADLCLDASQTKDRLIALTNIINTDLESARAASTVIISGQRYQFMKDLPAVISFVQTIQEDFSIEDFTVGLSESVNTKALLQILKIFYNQIMLGGFYLSNNNQTSRNNDPSKVWGQTNLEINNAINDLKSIDNANVTVSRINNSNFKNTGNANKLADLVRIVQRDLIAHASKAQISESFSTPTDTTVQKDLGSLIGQYRDSLITTTTLPQYKVDFDDVDTFTSVAPNSEIATILVKSDRTKKFNVLDSVDYLLYDELAGEANDVVLDNLLDFVNNYKQLALKLKSFNQLIFRDDETRHKCLSIIATTFTTFFDGSITKDEWTSEAPGVRMGLLMAASVDDNIADKLFEFICSSDGDKIAKANNLLKLCDGRATIDNRGSLETNPSDTTTGGHGWEDIQSEYLKNFRDDPDTSFGMFHTIAGKVESALASGKIGTSTETSASLGLTKNARAFVFYRLFLDILRKFYFKIEFGTDSVPPADEDLDTSYIQPEIKITYKSTQANPVRQALASYNNSRQELNDALNTNSLTQAYKNDVISIYEEYLALITSKIDEQEQNCLDLVNLIFNHSDQLTQKTSHLLLAIGSIKTYSRNAGIGDKESIMNSIQAEQAMLKKNIIDRYTYPLRGAAYLPAALDHNINQALNLKTAVLTLPALNDSPIDAINRKFMVAVGIPAGLMENLRYKNTFSTKEHLYSIDLVFKNLQISQNEEDSDTTGTLATVSKTFSTRIFVNEGYQIAGGADVISSTLTNYQQIYDATKYKYINDSGEYLDATPDKLYFMLGDRMIIENHLLSHYSKLLLKATAGITLDEEVFDLVLQTRRYPDAAQDANYTTIVDKIAVNYPDTAEGVINRDRALRDLSRSMMLSPDQHKVSMMTAKTFERIHVIPVDINEITSIFDRNGGNLAFARDLSFISVVAKISLADNQPPMVLSQSPTRRSATQAATDVASVLANGSDRDASVTGINKFRETMGGRR